MPGSFAPVLKLDHRQLTPGAPPYNVGLVPYLVAYLQDNNGDGHAGPGDIPSLIYTTSGGGDAPRLVAINGRTGALIWKSTFEPGETPLVRSAF